MADADALRDPGLADRRGIVPSSSPPPVDPPPAGATGEKVMSLVDHLSELRTRLFKTALAIAAGTVVGFYYSTPVRDFLISPLPTHQVQVLAPGDAFIITMKISLVVGVILAMPVILYQGWAFIAPGLTPDERRVVRPWVPLALVFFAIGVAIAYVVLPFATSFLLSFTDQTLVANIAAGPYFDFVTTLFLGFGLVMEFPILLFGLSRVGILTSKRMKSARRMVILGIAIFSAVITPGGDLVSPTVLGVTMYVLFEGTVFFIARTGR
ncbi:MAG TPA: twin-arginine translocase subunit TatC [Candidatus Dormibacteraeota bacterium]|nr:twin-arginine translocase subunit TatC [Candidatus Dormibacteraeota bacterium]